MSRITAPRDVNDFLHSLVNDPEVQAAVKDYILSGKEGAAQLFFEAAAYVVGRPTETVQLEITAELARLLSVAYPSGAEEKRGEDEHARDGGSPALPQ